MRLKTIFATLGVLSLFLLNFGSLEPASAQLVGGVLDPTRSVNWSLAGSSSIPDRPTVCATLNPGATATQINNAISACPAGQTVFLSAGNYNNLSGIRMKDNVTLRGAGPDQTFLTFTSADGCGGKQAAICTISSSPNWVGNSGNVGDGSQQNNADWTAGYAQGSSTITLGANTLGTQKPQIGTVLILDQLNDGTSRSQDTGNIFNCSTAVACTQSNGGNGRTNRNQQQLVTVTSVSGTGPYTVGITPPIYMPNWRTSQQPKAWWQNGLYATGVGLEAFSLTCNGCATYSITFYDATNSWIKNIRSVRLLPEPVGNQSDKHVLFFQSVHETVRDSYFFGRSLGDEYGMNYWEACDVLVENNILQRMGTPILFESGCGNVVAYNYTINDYWNEGIWGQGSFYGHGGHEDYLLAEGNDGEGFEMENYFGPAFFVTAFRNRYWGFQQGYQNQTVPVFDYGLNRYESLVGNILGTVGYHTKYQSTPSTGDSNCNFSIYAIGLGDNCSSGDGTSKPLDDPTTLNTLMRWGNWDVVSNNTKWDSSEVPSNLSLYANAVPASQTLPVSLYLSSKPAWWPNSIPFPPIGPDVTGGNVAGSGGHTYAIPARACFENVMHGTFGDTTPRTFNANNCYLATGLPADTTAPSTPTNLSATATSFSQVDLSWGASNDNVGVGGYKVFRNGSQIGTANTSAYQDTTVSASTAYTYTVSAYDTAGNNSNQSAAAQVTTPAAPAQTIVQSASAQGGTAATSIAKAFDSGNTAGNLIVVAFSFDSTGGTAYTCSDSQGNSYSQATFTNDTRHNQTLGICYAANVKAGANTVTVSYGAVSHQWRSLAIHEYKGFAASSPLDKFAVTTGTSAAPVSASVTPSQSNELIFGAVSPDNGTPTVTAGSGFRLVQSVTNLSSEDQILPSTSSIAAGFSFDSAQDYIAVISTFKPSAPSGTPLTGDINLDHIVNSIDYSILNAHWFTSDATSDLNHDGLVNAIDYSLMNANWFKTW